MSCDQRENGQFSFKQSGYTKVMREVRKMFQALDNYRYDVAVCIYEVLKENKVKKNKESAKEFIRERVGKDRYVSYDTEYKNLFKSRKVTNQYNFEIDKELINLALEEIFRNNNNTLLKPRRVAYPKLTNKDKSFRREFNELIYVTLSEKDSMLYWSVRQGNRTVDEANSHCVTLALFKILSEYKWAYGEGGETVMVSENFDDDPCTPNELPETTRKYERLTQAEQKRREKFRVAMAKQGLYY